MKPIIGIVSNVLQHSNDFKGNVEVSYTIRDFIKGVNSVGGIPITIPISLEEDVKVYIDMIDGLLLAGGQDVSPFLYGEEPIIELGNTFLERDLFEIALIKEAMQQKKPIFGICRGLQIINVALGGTLHQDIPSQYKTTLKHNQQEEQALYPIHTINIDKDSILYDIVGEGARVNSLHHQSIKDLAGNLKVTARSIDEIVEGVESTDKEQYILAVQWHPEILLRNNDKSSKLLFADFVKKCSSNKR